MTPKKSKVTQEATGMRTLIPQITVLYEFRKHVDTGCSLICSRNSKFFPFPTNSVIPVNSHVIACADTVYSDAANDELKVLLPGDVFSCSSA